MEKVERDSSFKHDKNVFVQCKNNIKPLIKELKKEGLDEEILNHLYILVSYCMMKEYVRANDIYM